MKNAYKSSMLDDYQKTIENLEENNVQKLRIEQSIDSLRMVRFKNDVYRNYVYFCSLAEQDNSLNPTTRFVYYNLNANQQTLDNLRIYSGTQSLDYQRTIRDRFIYGLLAIYYLVSKGKIYDVPINPLNFIIENEKKVKAFYREDRELGEITDEWLMSFKKLLAYYLVVDTSIIPEKFNDYTIQDLVSVMSQGTKHGFKRFYNCTSIDEMLPLFMKEDEINALNFTYPLSEDFQEPEDISSGIPLDFDSAVVNSTYTQVEDTEELKQKLLDENKLDKKKVRKADKRKKQREKDLKKRDKQLSKKPRKDFEPNESKRKVNAYNKKYNQRGMSVVPLVAIVIFAIMIFAIMYSVMSGKPLLNLGGMILNPIVRQNMLDNIEPTSIQRLLWLLA